MRENILNIYDDLDEKEKFRDFVADELGIGRSTLHKYFINRDSKPSPTVTRNEKELHKLIVNWRKQELQRSGAILQENA